MPTGLAKIQSENNRCWLGEGTHADAAGGTVKWND